MWVVLYVYCMKMYNIKSQDVLQQDISFSNATSLDKQLWQ